MIIADPTGLCFGVRRAIEQLESTLLSVIGLQQEARFIIRRRLRLKRWGCCLWMGRIQCHWAESSLFEPTGGPVELQVLQDRSALVVDGTCPFVRTAQQRAKTLSDEGYRVLILGDKNHPGVRDSRLY